MSYLYVLSPTLALVGFGVFDVAKIHIFPDITRKRNPCRPEGGRGGAEVLFMARPQGADLLKTPMVVMIRRRKPCRIRQGFLGFYRWNAVELSNGELDRRNIVD